MQPMYRLARFARIRPEYVRVAARTITAGAGVAAPTLARLALQVRRPPTTAAIATAAAGGALSAAVPASEAAASAPALLDASLAHVAQLSESALAAFAADAADSAAASAVPKAAEIHAALTALPAAVTSSTSCDVATTVLLAAALRLAAPFPTAMRRRPPVVSAALEQPPPPAIAALVESVSSRAGVSGAQLPPGAEPATTQACVAAAVAALRLLPDGTCALHLARLLPRIAAARQDLSPTAIAVTVWVCAEAAAAGLLAQEAAHLGEMALMRFVSIKSQATPTDLAYVAAALLDPTGVAWLSPNVRAGALEALRPAVSAALLAASTATVIALTASFARDAEDPANSAVLSACVNALTPERLAASPDLCSFVAQLLQAEQALACTRTVAADVVESLRATVTAAMKRASAARALNFSQLGTAEGFAHVAAALQRAHVRGESWPELSSAAEGLIAQAVTDLEKASAEKLSSVAFSLVLRGCSIFAALSAAAPVAGRTQEQWDGLALAAVRRVVAALADARTAPSARVLAACLAPVALRDVQCASDIRALVERLVSHSPSVGADAVVLLHAAAELAGSDVPALRDIARTIIVPSLLGDPVANASPRLLVVVAQCLGILRVRVEELCAQIADAAIAKREDLSGDQIAQILYAFARVDYRNARVFAELAPRVRVVTATTSPSACIALVVAYAHAGNYWSYKLYARLTDRIVEAADVLRRGPALALLNALIRVEVRHDRLTAAVVQMLAAAPTAGLGTAECVGFLSALARIGGGGADEGVVKKLFGVLEARRMEMDAEQVAETMLALSRVYSGSAARQQLDAFIPRALALAPTAPGATIGPMLTALAAAQYPHEELFSVVSDRALSLQNQLPSLSVCAILSAFAAVGLRDDRLFVEMIPRARFVAHHGSAQDVANLVTAYTAVHLWHYKLFVRLAERAIAVRSDATAQQLAQILRGFARVEMRYDKLFIETSPRLQVVANVATAADVAAIADAYAAMGLYDAPLFAQLADRAVAVADTFTPQLASEMLAAFTAVGVRNEKLHAALASKAAAVPPTQETDVTNVTA